MDMYVHIKNYYKVIHSAYTYITTALSEKEKCIYVISMAVFVNYLVHTTQVSSLSLQGIKWPQYASTL